MRCVGPPLYKVGPGWPPSLNPTRLFKAPLGHATPGLPSFGLTLPPLGVISASADIFRLHTCVDPVGLRQDAIGKAQNSLDLAICAALRALGDDRLLNDV